MFVTQRDHRTHRFALIQIKASTCRLLHKPPPKAAAPGWRVLQGVRAVDEISQMNVVTGPSGTMRGELRGSPRQGLIMATWGFFIGFAAVALYGPAAHAFQQSMQLSPLLVGILVAAPQLTGSLLRIPFGAWVDKVGGRLPMLTLFGASIVGMWGLVFILVTVPNVTPALYPVILLF